MRYHDEGNWPLRPFTLRGLYPLSVEATDIYEQARETVRDFIGARSAREIVFTRNTTESLNLVAYSYGLTHVKAGDEVLVSIMEHHSDLLPWQMVCRQTGAELKFIECAPDGSVDLRQIESLITERTKIVAMTQVSNVLGRKYPVQEVAAMAHKKGAVMVVDGAQSTPHMPVNVQELGADFFKHCIAVHAHAKDDHEGRCAEFAEEFGKHKTLSFLSVINDSFRPRASAERQQRPGHRE